MELTKKMARWGTCTAMLLLAGNVGALTIDSGPVSGSRSAEAVLNLSGGVLTIDLLNTGAIAVNNPDVLTGLFFSLPTGTTLSTVSASLYGASTFVNGTGSNPGNGWVYQSGLGTAAQGQNSGISAAGLGVFGNTGFFGPNPVLPLDGAGYGIINGIATVNHLNPGPQISNEIEFKLNVSGPLDLNALGSTLVFQWGTALDEGSGGPGVPDGGTTVLLLGTALSGIALLRRKLS